MVLGGGAGRVIAAYDKNVRRRVAVKFIRSEKASDIALVLSKKPRLLVNFSIHIILFTVGDDRKSGNLPS